MPKPFEEFFVGPGSTSPNLSGRVYLADGTLMNEFMGSVKMQYTTGL